MGADMATVRPYFDIGEFVRVRDLPKAGHVRVPFYARDKVGRIIQFCGCYLNPEDLATGNSAGSAVELYSVAFQQTELWPDDENRAGDQLVMEVYAHWLQRCQADQSERD